MLSRRGSTLLELIVALTLGALVLGTATTSLRRQQRISTRLGALFSEESQLRVTTAILAAELPVLTPSVGDVAEARDTALQLRAPMLTSFACRSEEGQVTLPVGGAADAPLTAITSQPRVGDTLWWYPGDGASWSARRISNVRNVTAPCDLAPGATSAVLRLAFGGADSIIIGSPLRVTRQLRYVVYRGGDGNWQMGLREWSEATQRFASPQPFAGPFLSRLETGERTGFRFYDVEGGELTPGADPIPVERIRRVRITTLSFDRSYEGGPASVRRDSVDVALQRVASP